MPPLPKRSSTPERAAAHGDEDRSLTPGRDIRDRGRDVPAVIRVSGRRPMVISVFTASSDDGPLAARASMAVRRSLESRDFRSVCRSGAERTRNTSAPYAPPRLAASSAASTVSPNRSSPTITRAGGQATSLPGTTRTGQAARRAFSSETLPITTRLIGPSRRLPATIRSAAISPLTAMTSSTGRPTRGCTRAASPPSFFIRFSSLCRASCRRNSSVACARNTLYLGNLRATRTACNFEPLSLEILGGVLQSPVRGALRRRPVAPPIRRPP